MVIKHETTLDMLWNTLHVALGFPRAVRCLQRRVVISSHALLLFTAAFAATDDVRLAA
jgi:hypothetical protein